MLYGIAHALSGAVFRVGRIARVADSAGWPVPREPGPSGRHCAADLGQAISPSSSVNAFSLMGSNGLAELCTVYFSGFGHPHFNPAGFSLKGQTWNKDGRRRKYL